VCFWTTTILVLLIRKPIILVLVLIFVRKIILIKNDNNRHTITASTACWMEYRLRFTRCLSLCFDDHLHLPYNAAWDHTNLNQCIMLISGAKLQHYLSVNLETYHSQAQSNKWPQMCGKIFWPLKYFLHIHKVGLQDSLNSPVWSIFGVFWGMGRSVLKTFREQTLHTHDNNQSPAIDDVSRNLWCCCWVHLQAVYLQPFSGNVISWVQSMQPTPSLVCGQLLTIC